MELLVYYSMVPRQPHIDQWIKSVRTLRRFNSSLAIHLFIYDEVPGSVRVVAGECGVVVHECGLYAPAEGLWHCSVLRKFAHGNELPEGCRALYLDCDTWCYHDLGGLFDRYIEADIYAREEVLTRASPFGYDPTWIDEDRLAVIVKREALRSVPLLNTGVVLFNNGSVRGVAAIMGEAVRYTGWLLSGPSGSPLSGRSAWVADEVGWGLALGRTELSVGLFCRGDVIQGAECTHQRPPGVDPILAHYWSGHEQAFFADPAHV